MKYLVIFIVGLTIWFGFYMRSNLRKSLPLPEASPASLEFRTKKPGETINFNQKTYKLFLQKISVPQNLRLITNFEDKKTSQTLIMDNQCRYGINAGFYTNEDMPLGLMFAQDKYINSQVHNSLLLNGFFYKTTDGNLGISDTYPENKLDFVFQSGPLFTPQSKLKITDDKQAKRSLIAKSADSWFYLLAVVDSANSQNGPLLSDLPGIIREFNNNSRIKLTDLLNLDGGSASAFYDDSGNALEELTFIGALICGK